MAACEFCGTALGREGAERFRCRVCRAGYEVREHLGRVSYECFDDPPAEIYNYALVRKRLLEAAQQVIPQPEAALSLVADTWVELTSYVKPEEYCPERELATLRAKWEDDRRVLLDLVATKLTDLQNQGLLYDHLRLEILDVVQDWKAGQK
jgi:hypothetical protein